MSTNSERVSIAPHPSATARDAVTRVVFPAAIFASAFLLFSVQPLFTRMILPLFGGSPAVWAVGVCFFQVLLLCGYAYAHGLEVMAARRFPLAAPLAIGCHVLVLVSAAFMLPLGVDAAPLASNGGNAYVLLVTAFGAGVGLPFFALSANAPLLQVWFAKLKHRRSSDPYFLYAVSNAGSMTALVSYPTVIEPLYPLGSQREAWSLGFVLLCVAIFVCAILSILAKPAFKERGANVPASDGARAQRISWSERFSWSMLAFIPSGLLVSFTTFVTTDVASAPLLWVIPLSIYLATYVIAFRGGTARPSEVLRRSQPVAAGITLWASQSDAAFAWAAGCIAGLIAFFLTALDCHQRLYAQRPAARRATEYYLWMSAGGALGGMFASLAAPQLFTTVAEFPIFLGLGTFVAVLPLSMTNGLASKRLVFGLFLASLAVLALKVIFQAAGVGSDANLKPEVVALAAVAVVLLARWPVVAASATLFLIGTTIAVDSGTPPLAQVRTFFGTHRVAASSEGRLHMLLHGMTLHGMEVIKQTGERPTPLAYYHVKQPLAFGLYLARLANGGPRQPLRVGIVGLGTGAMACHSVEGDSWHFFEIDPAVVEIARAPEYFTYLSACQPTAAITIGDARLTLAREEPGSLDYLLIDAFSSDAIPVHLMTVEAIKLYLSLLSERGVLVLHLTNQNLDLPPVIESDLAGLEGYQGVYIDANGGGGAVPTEAILIAKQPELIRAALSFPNARLLARPAVRAWTDDYSNIVSALLRRYRQRLTGAFVSSSHR